MIFKGMFIVGQR